MTIETPIKPYESWVWNDDCQNWVTPNGKEVPGNGKPYQWSDELLDWVEVVHN
jgi:hypothetical protein